MFEFQTIYLFDVHSSILKKIMVGKLFVKYFNNHNGFVLDSYAKN